MSSEARRMALREVKELPCTLFGGLMYVGDIRELFERDGTVPGCLQGDVEKGVVEVIVYVEVLCRKFYLEALQLTYPCKGQPHSYLGSPRVRA